MNDPYFTAPAASFAKPYPDIRIPDTATWGGSILVAIFLGAYVLFKSLKLLGFPVWLWLHQLLQLMTQMASTISQHLPSPFRRVSASAADGDTNCPDSTMQRRGSMVLSSVFGLKNSGLLKGVTGALSKSYSNVPPGLGNWDNSCYQNSVIQGLASLPSVSRYLSETTSSNPQFDTETMNGALFDMITKLNDAGNHGQHFWIRGKLKSMSTWQQQDAQEYFSTILEGLDKEVDKALKSKRRAALSWQALAKHVGLQNTAKNTEEKREDESEQADVADEQTEQTEQANRSTEADLNMSQESPEIPHFATNPLGGLIAQRVSCTKCGYTEGLQLIPSNCLTVPLGNGQTYDITDCLDDFTKLEEIDGIQCAKCTLLRTRDTLERVLSTLQGPMRGTIEARFLAVQEALDEDDFKDDTLIKKCGVPKKNWVESTKSKQQVIARAPKALVLHVNRSGFNLFTGEQYKKVTRVSFPAHLNLSSWCIGNPKAEPQKPSDVVEEWTKDPEKSMLADSFENLIPRNYALRAVVMHVGRHENGHYICYRKHALPSTEVNGDQGEQWWRLSDENVYSVSEEDALAQAGVFMLFYERIDEDAEPRTLPEASTTYAAIAEPETVPLPPAKHELYDSVAPLDETALEVGVPEDDGDDELSMPPSPRLGTSSPAVDDSLVADLQPILPSPQSHNPNLPTEQQRRSPSPRRSLSPRRSRSPPTLRSEPEGETQSTILTPGTEHSTPDPTFTDEDDTSIADTTSMSNAYDSDTAPSTLMTSDDEVEPELMAEAKAPAQVPKQMNLGPHRMRTAGDGRRGPGRGDGVLPMVGAV